MTTNGWVGPCKQVKFGFKRGSWFSFQKHLADIRRTDAVHDVGMVNTVKPVDLLKEGFHHVMPGADDREMPLTYGQGQACGLI